MRKRIFALSIATMLTISLCACGANRPIRGNRNDRENNFSNSSLQSPDSDESNSTKENENTENITTNNNAAQDNNNNETNTNNNIEQDTEETTSSQITNNTATLQDGHWVNFDKMQFSINGKIYTLGVSTLQEMIDDGVPFKEDSLSDAKNNIKPNYQSAGYKIVLGEYWTAQVYVGNYTDTNASANELPIVEFYFPNHPDKTQNIVSFAFPINLTEAQLLSECGEPNKKKLDGLENEFGTNTYKYTKESSQYFSDSKFQFDFLKGQLKYFYMTYIP